MCIAVASNTCWSFFSFSLDLLRDQLAAGHTAVAVLN
jgi:hypothetical protein